MRKRNIEFQQLEDRLRQFEEKVNEWIFFNFISTNVFVFFQTHKFEQLHQLQVQTFEKTIRDCQIENDRKIDEYEILIKQISLRFI